MTERRTRPPQHVDRRPVAVVDIGSNSIRLVVFDGTSRVPLPLFNQRQGQILEAQADAAFADAQFASRRQQLLGEIDYAIAGYSIARQQVDAFESGLIRQAEQTVRVAEAAYRFGERGIIEYLDAQRTLRGVRQEYINALYEARYALIEVERLVGVDVLGGIR